MRSMSLPLEFQGRINVVRDGLVNDLLPSYGLLSSDRVNTIADYLSSHSADLALRYHGAVTAIDVIARPFLTDPVKTYLELKGVCINGHYFQREEPISDKFENRLDLHTSQTFDGRYCAECGSGIIPVATAVRYDDGVTVFARIKGEESLLSKMEREYASKLVRFLYSPDYMSQLAGEFFPDSKFRAYSFVVDFTYDGRSFPVVVQIIPKDAHESNESGELVHHKYRDRREDFRKKSRDVVIESLSGATPLHMPILPDDVVAFKIVPKNKKIAIDIASQIKGTYHTRDKLNNI